MSLAALGRRTSSSATVSDMIAHGHIVSQVLVTMTAQANKRRHVLLLKLLIVSTNRGEENLKKTTTTCWV